MSVRNSHYPPDLFILQVSPEAQDRVTKQLEGIYNTQYWITELGVNDLVLFSRSATLPKEFTADIPIPLTKLTRTFIEYRLNEEAPEYHFWTMTHHKLDIWEFRLVESLDRYNWLD